MEIKISGHHIDIGDSFREYMKEKLEHLADKFFESAVSSTVIVTKDKAPFIQTKILVNEGMGNGVIAQSSAESDEPYTSFDIALNKLQTQLKKHRSKLKDRHEKRRMKASFIEAMNYVLTPYQDEDFSGDAPAVIAEKMSKLPHLDLEHAVVDMDLQDKEVMIFYNTKTLKLNVLYYRKDGNISWIELPKV